MRTLHKYPLLTKLSDVDDSPLDEDTAQIPVGGDQRAWYTRLGDRLDKWMHSGGRRERAIQDWLDEQEAAKEHMGIAAYQSYKKNQEYREKEQRKRDLASGNVDRYEGIAIPENIRGRGAGVVRQYVESRKNWQKADTAANAAMDKNMRLENLDPLSQKYNFKNTTLNSPETWNQYGKAIKGFVMPDKGADNMSDVRTVVTNAFPVVYANQAEFEANHPVAAERIKKFNDYAPIAMKAMAPIPMIGPGIAAAAEPYAAAVMAHRIAREGHDAVRGFGKYQGQSGTSRAVNGTYNMAAPLINKYVVGKTMNPIFKNEFGVNMGNTIPAILNKELNYGAKPALKYVGKALAKRVKNIEDSASARRPSPSQDVVDSRVYPENMPKSIPSVVQQAPTNQKQVQTGTARPTVVATR